MYQHFALDTAMKCRFTFYFFCTKRLSGHVPSLLFAISSRGPPYSSRDRTPFRIPPLFTPNPTGIIALCVERPDERTTEINSKRRFI